MLRRSTAVATAPGSLQPWAIFPLLLPWSVAAAYTTTAMAFFLSNAGVSTLVVASYLAVGMVPDTSKVLWAPLVDTTLGPRRWHAVGVVGAVASLLVLGFVHVSAGTLPLITVVALLGAAAATFVHLSTDVILAYDVAETRKGRAGGWGAAANLGGSAVGGALAIYLAQQRLPMWAPAGAMALVCVVVSPFTLMASPRPSIVKPQADRTGLKALVRDLWDMISSPNGALTLFLLALPIGSVDVQALLPAIAKDWRAHASEVVFVTGVGGGVVQMGGALLGGLLADRLDRKLAFCLTGLLIAGVVGAMALAPHTPLNFVMFSTVYLALQGVSFAAFVAVEFDTIGKGAAATKCMLLVCVSNLSITLFQLGDGYVHDTFGVTAMLLISSGAGLASIMLFGLVTWWRGRLRKPSTGAAPAA